ncbi:hypothetical protein DL89DRAFT_1254 [Linderina pennispora]|uniref:Uncharacterized protein n=1 Tax=Linderina pennispora TaxID=61395 RepID=A0A1Y1WJG5_9FUNG|nr:uncharacterized protein DL89DRAFT_1254 [Linderina pennispora]ORX73622.1 hypothetical protein DL89DRAFT_1254 [Linderina pennispora]
MFRQGRSRRVAVVRAQVQIRGRPGHPWLVGSLSLSSTIAAAFLAGRPRPILRATLPPRGLRPPRLRLAGAALDVSSSCSSSSLLLLPCSPGHVLLGLALVLAHFIAFVGLFFILLLLFRLLNNILVLRHVVLFALIAIVVFALVFAFLAALVCLGSNRTLQDHPIPQAPRQHP